MVHKMANVYDAMVEKEIARRAFDYWQRRGCPSGSPEQDWFQAVADLEREDDLHADARLGHPSPLEGATG